jgi:hypothetical protein
MRAIWSIKWNLARLIVALVLLVMLASDQSARLARLQLAAMPDFDFVQEVRALGLQGRYAEALSIVDACLLSFAQSATEGDAATIRALQAEKSAALEAQASSLRVLTDAGMGALTGTSESLEGLLGAIASDMLVVGDVRDLLIQGGKLALDGEADPVIAGLSGLGLVTTLAPQVDWGPSLLKIARKIGAMSDALADSIVGLVRLGKRRELLAISDDLAVLAKGTSPATAVSALKHIDDPADLARLARFTDSAGPQGVLVLHIGGKQAAKIVATTAQAGAQAQTLALKAAAKGPAGLRWLQTPLARSLFKPHLLVGVAKGLYKGTLPLALERTIQRLDPFAWIALPMVAVWTLFEATLLIRRFFGTPIAVRT